MTQMSELPGVAANSLPSALAELGAKMCMTAASTAWQKCQCHLTGRNPHYGRPSGKNASVLDRLTSPQETPVPEVKIPEPNGNPEEIV